MIAPMVEPTTVWMVPLQRGRAEERKGVLTLEDDGVTFLDESLDQVELLRFGSVRRVRRVRGSPILIVTHRIDDDSVETAFYFCQPPPLTPPAPGDEPSPAALTTPSGKPLGAFSSMRRSSRRRHVRENVRYLTSQSATKKTEVQAWVDEITARTRE
jgi:hypothetical protein